MEKITFIIEKAHLSGQSQSLLRKPRFNYYETERSRKMQKKGRPHVSPERSDITHQCLMTLLDSPLNKAGKLRIYVRTVDNVLIEVNPAIRIPRTTSRFNGLIKQLLTNLKIKGTTGDILMKVVKNPVTEYLSPGSIKVGLSQEGVRINKENLKLNLSKGYCFYINAIPSGKEDNFENVECLMKVSDFPLSAALCCGKLCNMFEELYNIF
ncbi:Ribosomal RNA small subunit methyltransferase NEP1 [Astathelohania contejeani]|uniref:Ribosomal RNA small subunit methyltransferase NEP1 n=1 Tax=Astathelohania contejeani TaxID=164912 RepID=A0ABQ7I210_9MICR|nr:Ribosomal RNA small subunit methyltransferase NEP1 [Thelohania contejeani]